ncbi:phosphotransferase family protein [Knoellia sp. CPCC 206435]|uniref:phosphotransferase family protein n=1 Tax=Knoellia terrae TaxID=3404797 RepID=UPI003B42841C
MSDPGPGPGPVPSVIDIEGDTLVVGRAWPRPVRDGDRVLLVEGRDGAGRLRAGRLDLRRSGTGWAVTGSRVPPPGEDSRLPGLAEAAAAGTLVVHRHGRRAVVRLDTTYVKLVRPGVGEVVARAATHGRALARAAGFDAPTVEEVGDAQVTFGALPGPSLHELGARVPTGEWARWWGLWAAAWPALAQPAAVHAGAASLPRHSPADEAAVVRRWVQHVTDFDALPEDARRRLGQRADAVADALDVDPAQQPVVSHRDLHDKQVLAHANRLGLLDFDMVALAEPALDLANLFVHAGLRADQGHWSPSHRDIAQRTVLAVAARMGVDLGRFETYAEASRVRLACLYAFRPGHRDLALGWAGTAPAPRQSASPSPRRPISLSCSGRNRPSHSRS